MSDAVELMIEQHYEQERDDARIQAEMRRPTPHDVPDAPEAPVWLSHGEAQQFRSGWEAGYLAALIALGVAK
jgi:hypothetical protein